MSSLDAVSRLAAGSSAACVIYAFGSLFTRLRGCDRSADEIALRQARRLNACAWTIMAIAAISYRPIHALWLLNSPADKLMARICDLLAASLGCIAFILVISARAFARGVSPRMVSHGFIINCSVALAIVAATWLTR